MIIPKSSIDFIKRVYKNKNLTTEVIEKIINKNKLSLNKFLKNNKL